MFWVFAPPAQIEDGLVRIAGSKGRHLARVLRIRPGEVGVAVADRREHRIEVVAVEGSEVRARVLEIAPNHTERESELIVLQALLPGADFEAVLEGGTEVGVTRFVPILASRSVARPQGDRRARWQAVVESAAEQSHRGRIPDVTPPMTLSQGLHMVAGTSLVVLDPRAIEPLRPTHSAVAIAVGPEGGWTDQELEAMVAAGAARASLGPRILRARLAPVAAAVILSSAI